MELEAGHPTAGAPHALTEMVPCDFARIDLRPDAPSGDIGTMLAAAADPVGGLLSAFPAGSAARPSLVGTGCEFAELNRSRPAAAPRTAVAFTMNPQVHYFHDEAVIDNLLGLRSVLDSARTPYPDTPLVLGLVEFVPHNYPACA